MIGNTTLLSNGLNDRQVLDWHSVGEGGGIVDGMDGGVGVGVDRGVGVRVDGSVGGGMEGIVGEVGGG